MCGVLPWVIRSIFSICSPNCTSSLFNSQNLAAVKMDPELDSLIDQYHLSHKRPTFNTMGIKTFKQMAQIQSSALKEDHLFNYADIRAFDTFRDICIQKLEEKDNLDQQVKQRASSTPGRQIISEIGDARKPSPPEGPGMFTPPQLTINPPRIDPLIAPRYPQSTPNVLMDQLNSMHVETQYSPHIIPPIFSPPMTQNPFQTHVQFFHSIQPEQQHYTIGPDQRYKSLPSFQKNYYQELRPQIIQQRLPICPLSSDLFPYTGEPSIQYRDYQIYKGNNLPGIGLIFTNETFTNFPNRDGAKNDGNNFSDLFKMMGLRIYKYDDKTSDEIINILAENARDDLSDIEMFAVAFSTHGDKGDILYGSDNTPFSLYKQVINLFKISNCPFLRGKPKLFFIQACRGDKIDATTTPQGIQADSAERVMATLESDFLVAHSSVDGYKAYRHPNEGSWFVTQLKRAFDMFADECTMLEILSLTNQLVVEKSIMSSDGSDKYIQTCQFESTLTKLLRIKPIRSN